MSNKQYKTEWSFSFEEIGKKISNAFDNIGEDVEIKEVNYAEALGNATSAHIEIDLSVGETTISALDPDSTNLMEADIRYLGELEYHVSGDAEKRIYLGQKKRGNAFFDSIKSAIKNRSMNENELQWHIRLNPNVPFDIALKGGVGVTDAELGGLNINAIDVKGGVGETSVLLPISDTMIDVDIDGGVGETRVTVPENGASNVHVDGGVGEVTIFVPESAAVRVNSKGGMGDLTVPKSYKQTAKKEKDIFKRTGIWETEGFALNERQIEITFRGGVGSNNVKFIGEEKAKDKRKRVPSDPTPDDAPEIV